MAKRRNAPKPPEPKYHGWVEYVSRSDMGRPIDVEIVRCSPFADDGVCLIRVVHPNRSVNAIENFPITRLDDLVASLTDAIAAGRQHGVIPASAE